MQNPFEVLQQRMISMESKLEALLNVVEAKSGIAIQREEAANRAQAAKYLGVSVGTIDNLVRSKQLKPFRLGSSVRFTYTDLDEFIEKKKNG